MPPLAKTTALAVLVAAGLCEARHQQRYADMPDEQVSAAIARARAVEPFGARLQAVTEPFLGTPYVLGNMGEGPDGDGRDKDPRYNVKGADCTTFVEHAMAFAHAPDLGAAKALLDRIRYADGRVGYATRRHWPEGQWVHGLLAEGWVEDVTARLADGRVEESVVRVDRALLQSSAHEELKRNLKPDEVLTGDFAVPYVPAAAARALGQRLEAGLIINVVKAKKAGILTRIAHQGMIVKRGPAVFVRHASSVGKKAVLDEPYEAFVDRQGASKSWPTVGYNFLKVKDHPPAPRQAATDAEKPTDKAAATDRSAPR